MGTPLIIVGEIYLIQSQPVTDRKIVEIFLELSSLGP